MSKDFKELYKKGVDLGEQQKQRQKQLLNEQKQRRQLQQDEYRHGPDSDDDEVKTNEEHAEHSKTQHKPRRQRNRKTKNNTKGQHYRLQQSEWLRHRPENLADWLLVPCPVGKRCLVIASNGRTKVYNKGGRIVMQFRSLLPGDGHMQKLKTVLDCIHVPEQDIFYVLDALTFGQQQLLNCDANFRFFWLRSRFDEHGELSEISKRNEKPFKLLDYYDFEDASAVEQVLQTYPQWPNNQPQLDGLLFYHKEASYECGITPLVCWLNAFMLPDVLQLPVHSSYKAPEDYQPSAALEYMDEFDKKLLAQRQQHKKLGKTEGTKTAETAAATTSVAMEQEDELEEYAELRNMLDYQRRLELGELDMDCIEPASPAEVVAAPSSSC